MTATATPEVRGDIVDLLGLSEPLVIVAGFDRPNIHPTVRPVSGEAEKQRVLASLVHERRALVYTATRARAETAAAVLEAAGIEAAAYHDAMSETARTRVQDRFASGALGVVCATSAFGMGIDRPDIEAVVHADLPGSIEAYYQEIGRAGRDGRPAMATLLWTYADVNVAEIGDDMSKFPSAGHLLSWAGLCPRLDESAGKRRSTRIRQGAPWLKTTLVQIAWPAARKKHSYFQAQFLRLKSRRGPKKAIVAVAASMLTDRVRPV